MDNTHIEDEDCFILHGASHSIMVYNIFLGKIFGQNSQKQPIINCKLLETKLKIIPHRRIKEKC